MLVWLRPTTSEEGQRRSCSRSPFLFSLLGEAQKKDLVVVVVVSGRFLLRSCPRSLPRHVGGGLEGAWLLRARGPLLLFFPEFLRSHITPTDKRKDTHHARKSILFFFATR
jgi:hypothetical protein